MLTYALGRALDYAAAPADEVALVLVHGGGPKGSGTLTKLRKLEGDHWAACHWAEDIKAGKIQPRELEVVFEQQPAPEVYEPPVI